MTNDYERTLKIAAKKHDITGIRIYDEREKKIPNVGLVLMEDAETGEEIYVNTSDKTIRLNYAKHFNEQETHFKNVFTKSGAGTINSSVNESYVKKLLAYFKAR